MKIKVDNYSITPSRFIAGTKGSYGFDYMDIEFGEDWEGLSKKIIFCPPTGIPISVVWADKPIPIPLEVMSERGRTAFAVVGYENEKTKITVMGELDVLNTLPAEATNAGPAPTENELAQVMTYMEEAIAATDKVYDELLNRGFDANGWWLGTEVSTKAETVKAQVEYANEGDLYLNTDTFDVYLCEGEDVWRRVGCIKGDVGAAAGFGAAEASITMIDDDAEPKVSVQTSGDNTEKVFKFNFEMPSSYALGGGGTKVKRYSVRFADGAVNGAREDDAEGMVANVAVNDESVLNDFDSVPFFNRRICNGTWDPVEHVWLITAYQGEEEFSWDGSNGDVLYECKPFYVSDDTDINTYISVCGEPYPGYSLAPMFSSPTKKIYLPCFETYIASVSGVYVPYSRINCKPTSSSVVSFTNYLSKYDAYATWETAEIFYSEKLLQLVEFATKDLQSVMRGVCDLPFGDEGSKILSLPSENTVCISSSVASRMAVGQGAHILSSLSSATPTLKDATVTQITDNGDGTSNVSLSATTTSSSVGKYLVSGCYPSGVAAMAVTNASSGAYNSLNDGRSPIIWRGKENPWGNSRCMISNCYISRYQDSDGVTRDHLCYSYLKSGWTTTNYISSLLRFSYDLPEESGSVAMLRNTDSFAFVCVPMAMTDENTGVHYDFAALSGQRQISVGGSFADGDACGFSFNSETLVSATNLEQGIRFYMRQE